MATPDPFLQERSIPLPGAVMPELVDDLRRHGVRQAWMFGSRARGEAQPGSDWDFLVEFSSPPDFDRFMGLKLLLEDRLGSKVDLLSLSACKPRFLAAIQSELKRVA